MKNYSKLIFSVVLVVIIFTIGPILKWLAKVMELETAVLLTQRRNIVIVCITLLILIAIRKLKTRIIKRYDITKEDNLKSRKVYTKANLLEKVIFFIVITTGLGLILLSFESIREIGIGIFASAGVAGIIIGLSAQKVVGALLAGIQIAITQPFRIDDAVVVENEWGWIEEINLTYIVVRLWDKRRLVLPATYFLENPFQNWTRTNADIMGSVFLYTDYNVSFSALRKELTRLLESTYLWDRKVNVLQVTDSKETTVEIRILVSAKNSPTAWDLRVFIREKMIEYIQKNHPESLPRTRVVIKNQPDA